MDFSSLPAELVEEVARYLSLDDINACSIVNKQWRRAFDNNRIWKRHYTFQENYFDKQLTKQNMNSVEYFFGGCEAKEHIFNELRVKKNLIEGKYVLTSVDIGRFYCDNLTDFIDALGNHWLFISCSSANVFESDHLIEVWNMNGEPVKHERLKTPLTETRRLYDSQIRFIKNKLYYIVDHTCVVFEFSHPEYRLTVLFLVRCPYFTTLCYSFAMVYKPNMILGFVHPSINLQLPVDPWVHVWDGNDSSVLYTNYSNNEVDQMFEMTNGNIHTLLKAKDGGSSDNVLLVYTSYFDEFSLVLFSIKTFQYTTLLVKTRIKFIYCELVNEVVVLFYYKLHSRRNSCFIPKLLCYSTDGSLIYETEVRASSTYAHHTVLTAKEGKEVLVLDSHGVVNVFDIFQKQNISTFQMSKGENIATLIKNNLMIVHNLKGKRVSVQVWDFKHGKFLYDFIQLQSFYADSAFHTFAFTKSCRSPSKIFGIKHPDSAYAQFCTGNILMISFL